MHYFESQALTGRVSSIYLTEEEFVSISQRLDRELTRKELENFFMGLGDARQNMATISNFRTAFQSSYYYSAAEQDSEVEQQLGLIFRKFDEDQNGYIDRRELVQGFAMFGFSVSSNQLDAWFDQVSARNEGALSFKEFKSVFCDKMQRELLDQDRALASLKAELRRVDLNGEGKVNFAQLRYL